MTRKIAVELGKIQGKILFRLILTPYLLFRYRPSDNLVPSVNFKRVHIEANLEVDGTEEDYLIAPTSLDFHLLPLNAKRFSFEKRASYNVDG